MIFWSKNYSVLAKWSYHYNLLSHSFKLQENKCLSTAEFMIPGFRFNFDLKTVYKHFFNLINTHSHYLVKKICITILINYLLQYYYYFAVFRYLWIFDCLICLLIISILITSTLIIFSLITKFKTMYKIAQATTYSKNSQF